MPLSKEKCDRLMQALLYNLDGWAEQCEEIAQLSPGCPEARRLALHLKLNLAQTKSALLHLLDLEALPPD